jgi:hypothetical protein
MLRFLYSIRLSLPVFRLAIIFFGESIDFLPLSWYYFLLQILLTPYGFGFCFPRITLSFLSHLIFLWFEVNKFLLLLISELIQFLYCFFVCLFKDFLYKAICFLYGSYQCWDKSIFENKLNHVKGNLADFLVKVSERKED